jgi:hypothetical protein
VRRRVEQVDPSYDPAAHWSGPEVEELIEDAWSAPRGERGGGYLTELRGRIGAEFERAPGDLRIGRRACSSDLGANRCASSQFIDICGAQIPAHASGTYRA